MSGTFDKVDPQRVALYLRVLGGDLGAAQLWFDPRVVERYRARPGWRVMRTDTVGRVRSPEGWSLDSAGGTSTLATGSAAGATGERRSRTGTGASSAVPWSRP